jgi:hypothetical protein
VRGDRLEELTLSVLARLFRLFAASLVPGGGYFVAGWSPATALTLYWVDNVFGSVAMSLRIFLHRRATGAAGHSRAQLQAVVTTGNAGQEAQVEFRSFLTEFLVTSTGFSVAHGLFLAAVLGFVLERPDVGAVRQGAVAIAICHAIALTADRVTLANWPFFKLKEQAQRVMGRLALVNMALLGGTWALAFSRSPDSFFSVFVWLKAASDIGGMLPSMETRNPPRWLVRVMNLFPRQNGESFEDYWRRTRRSDEEKAALDEQVPARKLLKK